MALPYHGGVLPHLVRVDVQNDWLDYVTAAVGLLTAIAALWGLYFARNDAKRANVAAAEANQELATLRGVMEPTDRLLRTRAHKEMVQRLLDTNPHRDELKYDSEFLVSPTQHTRYVERAQAELVFLPDDALPLLRDLVDGSEGYHARAVRKSVEGGEASYAALFAEQEAYIARLDVVLSELENDPQATGGIYRSM